ncbi:hypothetical protein Tco_1093666 [Tanacetum coccineum]|uniref:Uncharacterized protein n=1 Tax=Tanacetum coccineum TaxID=301880 RepID=A0ABQ5CAX0_9ASTR
MFYLTLNVLSCGADICRITHIRCTDISKITRKQSKTGKHGHEESEEYKKEAKGNQSEARKVKALVISSQQMVKAVNHFKT